MAEDDIPKHAPRNRATAESKLRRSRKQCPVMSEDPVVAETRELRRQMMEEAGGTLDGLFDFLKKEQEAYRERLIRLPPRMAVPV